jgi:hypothetical protein
MNTEKDIDIYVILTTSRTYVEKLRIAVIAKLFF